MSALFALHRRADAYDLLRKRPSFPTIFLQEIFIHLSLVLGFPAMLEGLEFVRKMRPRNSPGRRRSPSGRGKRILRQIYGSQTDKLLQNIDRIHSDARSMIVNDVYGRVFSRHGLSLKERELMNVTVLALQGLDRQLYSHLRGSVRLGIHIAAMREALSLVQRVSKRSMRSARFAPSSGCVSKEEVVTSVRMNVAAHIVVRGLVQGVGFRYFVARNADRFNIRGYVKNLYNGDVEIVAEGERGSIEILIKEVKVGPRSAQVTDCVTEWADPVNTFKGFEIR